MNRRALQLALCAAPLFIVGCRVGPQYVVPNVPAPPAYKEAGPDAFKENTNPGNTAWQQAKPADTIPRGTWWSIFNDAELNKLEPQVETANQTLAQADANLVAARAEIRVRNTDRFPTVGTTISISGTRYSDNKPYFNAPGTNTGFADIQLPIEASYEADLWGAIHRNIAAGREEAQATAADRQSVLLSLQAELALDYFNLRIDDALQHLLNDTVSQYEHALRITTDRYNGGIAVKSDVTQAQTQLDAARVEASDVGIERAQYEHAIANLIGQAPSSLSVPYSPLAVDTQPPVVPAGLPSSLLERRPDIAAAERTMASANAQIGVAISSFYPTINLTGSYGFTGVALDGLFAASNAVWAVGPELALTVFDAGNREAQVEQARATYDQNVALYRQTVLTAFQQVEDQLAALRILEQEAVVQDRAVAAAVLAERLTLNQYEAGTVDYTTVITAQTNSLNNQQTALTVMQSRILANVSLVEALGGGWTVAQMPSGG